MELTFLLIGKPRFVDKDWPHCFATSISNAEFQYLHVVPAMIEKNM